MGEVNSQLSARNYSVPIVYFSLMKASIDCTSFTMFYVPQIGNNEGEIQVTTSIQSFKNNIEGSDLDGIRFTVKTGNPDFVKPITSAKYVLFFFSLVVGLWYWRSIKTIPSNMRVVEQSLILRQSLLLILYNDPFYGLIFYSPNHFQ